MRTLPAALGLAAALAFTTCGGDSNPEPTEGGLREAATRNAEAFLDKKWRAVYDDFTAQCRDTVTYSEFAAQLELSVAFAEGFMGFEWSDLDLDGIEIERVSEQEADVRVRLVLPGGEDLTDESEEPVRWVWEEDQWRSSDCEGLETGEDGPGGITPGGSAPPTETATEAPTGPGSSRAEAAAPGTPVTVSGWTITVTEVVHDAADLVLAENSFNDPPAEGHQFVLVTVEATYGGEEESSTLSGDVTFKVVGPSNVAYDYESYCGSIPGELETFRDVFQGGTIRGNLCWSVESSDITGLAMYGEESFSFESSRRWWSLGE